MRWYYYPKDLYKVTTNNNNTVIVKASQETLETMFKANSIKEYTCLKVYKVREVV